MKKILFINTTFGGGGAPKVARDLFDHINKTNGYEAYFAYGRGTKSDNPRTIKIGNIFEFFIHLFLVRALGLEGFGSYFSTRKLINFIKKEKPDIIHLHNLHGYYLNVFTLFRFLKTIDVSVIWTLHDEWSMTSLRAHSTGCIHCKTGKGFCTGIYTYPKAYFAPFLSRMLARKHEAFSGLKNMTIVSPAKWLAKSAKNSFLNQYPIKIVYNGVDTDLFKPLSAKQKIDLRIKYNLPTDKKIILFSAHKMSDENKGINYILSLARATIGEGVFFVGIGRMADPHINNLKIIGYINNSKKLAEFYGLSDLFIFPSVAETFSLVLLEVMASGLPVIGFDIPAFREVVDATTGILVPVKNQLALNEAVPSLLRDKNKIIEMGRAGSKKVLEHFTQQNFISGYMEIYERK
jgi:glycosyltransferase involved in cell wall biosynthesis